MEKVKLRIAELRHRKNITQQQLAEIVGVSFQTISKWESGDFHSKRYGIKYDNTTRILYLLCKIILQTILNGIIYRIVCFVSVSNILFFLFCQGVFVIILKVHMVLIELM